MPDVMKIVTTIVIVIAVVWLIFHSPLKRPVTGLQ
jgi:hypothetical protein